MWRHDREVLRFAAEHQRVVLTHDVATMVGHAFERVGSHQAMPGLIAVRSDGPIGRVIEDLEILVVAGDPEEIAGRILFVPL